MAYSLDLLFARQPYQRLVVPIEDSDPEALFIARWPSNQFATHGEFVQLLELYSSAMQGFIHGMDFEELIDWYIPEKEGDPAETPRDVKVIRHEDAAEWMKRKHPEIEIHWLKPGDHSEILDKEECGDFVAYGDAGYLYVLVADYLL